VHSTTTFSPFEIVYGFMPLTQKDLIPLPVDEKVVWMVIIKHRW